MLLHTGFWLSVYFDTFWIHTASLLPLISGLPNSRWNRFMAT
jgi:hypothetical protein